MKRLFNLRLLFVFLIFAFATLACDCTPDDPERNPCQFALGDSSTLDVASGDVSPSWWLAFTVSLP